MKKVTVTGAALTVASGRVALTAAQASPRMHNLKVVEVDEKGNGIFEVTAPVQFKHGEVFGHDGAIGKDGVISDPEDRRKPGETHEDAVARVRAELGPQIEQQLRDELRATMTASVEAQLRTELEPKIRAELEERIQAEQRVTRGAGGNQAAPGAPGAAPGTAALNLGGAAPAAGANQSSAQSTTTGAGGAHHADRTSSSPDGGKLDNVKKK